MAMGGQLEAGWLEKVEEVRKKSTFLRIHLLPLLFLLHLLFVLSLLLVVHVVLLVVALNHFVLGLESNTLSANTESQ